MSLRSRREQGFTLVEILIVVVILGILAAIVIPQFTNASEAARASNLNSQLQAIRSQLELYQIQHNGTYPTLAQMDGNTDAAGRTFDNLINITSAAGGIVVAGPNTFGPYLQKPPLNPFEASATVAAAGATAAGVGWTYNAVTGEILANLAAANPVVGVEVDAADVDTY